MIHSRPRRYGRHICAEGATISNVHLIAVNGLILMAIAREVHPWLEITRSGGLEAIGEKGTPRFYIFAMRYGVVFTRLGL